MSKDSTGNIVVGVDGSEVGAAAVRYAAVRARREGCGVHVVHVLPHMIPMNPMLPLGSADTFPEVGARIVDAARIEAEKVGGSDVRVTTAVVEGHRASAIVNEAEGARLIVLGHADRSRIHMFTDRTFAGVAAHSSCPVIAVPATWHDLSRDKIVVGVADTEQVDGALEEAFRRADAMDAQLAIVHAWMVDNAYEDIIFDRVEREEIRRRGEAGIRAAITGLRSDFPEVEVSVVVEHAEPARAVLNHSQDATLVILGRRSRHGLPDLQLGSTTRTVVRHATCPVEVVPVSASAASPAS
ncbi:universal stress protein [Aeromicrobium sp. 9AM]|uniref:universal stress protein n=1 Tax=Aeromicrobium sp. 9AM TaxID=2653126 RepID=UPI0012EFA969|nr:universal stress protein [Aeromicrobium sp. 9AM]VXC13043.1 putative Nucleotide-binding universal stress protein, UspA family [Aeromicrobium sp. 9AM]